VSDVGSGAPAGDSRAARTESPIERLDRHWAELLQEVRVVQTGVQLLTAFLLVLPFQDRFWELSDRSHGLYLTAVVLSAAATGCLITPVAMHRLLFRLGARPTLVNAAQKFALAGIALLGLAVVAVITWTFGIVVSPAWGITAGAVALTFFTSAWLILPLMIRRQIRTSSSGSDGAGSL
jgi:hypothetical protein